LYFVQQRQQITGGNLLALLDEVQTAAPS